MKNSLVKDLLAELSDLPMIEAVALGGSRAGENYDENSDYDIYLYCTQNIPEETRKKILEKYCGYMEIGNHFWEYEDNCTLKNGIDIDILYRNLEKFCEEVACVVENFEAHNGYTTCMWHNLLQCKIICDKNGRLLKAKQRFDIPYPEKLKVNIINKNLDLLYRKMPAYRFQIAKAMARKDIISINHRVSAFMESYFDILFAINEKTHFGEKKLIFICQKNLAILPDNFEENLHQFFQTLFIDSDTALSYLDNIINELQKITDSI